MTTDDLGDALITCIYCLKTRAPSKEHALPRGLGGNLTLNRVCEPCNNGFTAIDEHLADNSLVTILRVAHTARSSFKVRAGGTNTIRTSSGRPLHARVGNDFTVEVSPQVRFRPAEKGEVQLGANVPDERGARALAAWLERQAASGFSRTYARAGDWLSDGEAAVVLHQRTDGMIVLGEGVERDDAVAFLRQVTPKLVSSLRRQDLGESESAGNILQMNTAVRIDDFNRAIAKTAFNLLAASTPHDFVLDPAMHPLREFIRGHLQPDPSAGGVDTRFVRLVRDDDGRMTFKDYEHLVMLNISGGVFMAIITLYRGLTLTVTAPCPNTNGKVWTPFEAKVAVFKGDRQTSKWLKPSELAGLLGLDQEVDASALRLLDVLHGG